MKIPKGITPNFDWAELFKIGKYTVWSKVDLDGSEVIYQVTEGKKPEYDSGYYHLGPLLTMHNL